MPEIFQPKYTYCTNVFEINNTIIWKKTLSFFAKFVEKLQKENNLQHSLYQESKTLNLGLWCSSQVVDAFLKTPQKTQEIKVFLAEQNINAFTMNGFPYGEFHQKQVKTKVYFPDWSTQERLNYTIKCALFLAQITNYSKVTISTLPLGWGDFWSVDHEQKSLINLYQLVIELQKIEETYQIQVMVCLEPEPGCVLEKTKQVIDFWNRKLRPYLQKQKISLEVINRYLGICYDTCHQSVQFEESSQSLQQLVDHEIPIGKMQVSNALEFLPDVSKKFLDLKKSFVEEKFLHQTRISKNTNEPESILEYHDLDLALENTETDWNSFWRVHYHVPLFLEEYLTIEDTQSFQTTIQQTLKAVQYVLTNKICEHFEIETYTWSILPTLWRPKSKEDLVNCVVKEWQWLQNQIKNF